MYTLFLLFVSQVLGYVTVKEMNFTLLPWTPPSNGEDFPEFAELVTNPSNLNVNLTGRVIYTTHSPFAQLAYMKVFLGQVEGFKKRGAIGIICSPKDNRIPGNVVYGAQGLYNTKIPIGIVSRDLYDFAKSSLIVNVSFHGWETNPWYFTRAGAGYVIFSVTTGALYLFNIALSGYRLAKWIYVINGIDYTLGFICLSLEFICNLLRILQIIFYGTWNNFALHGADLLVTLPWCITLITSILIVFFWLDLTSDPFYHGKFLGIMKIPAIIFIVICFLLEMICYIMRLVSPIDFYTYVIVFYGVSLALIVFFNFTAAYRVLQPLKKAPETKKKLRRIVYRIIFSGIATLMGVVVFFLFFGTFNQTPNGWLLIWWGLYFSFWLQSVLLILIFQVPKKAISSSAKETKDPQSKDNPSKSTE